MATSSRRDRQPIDLGDLLWREAPVERAEIGLDLLGLGRTGDDAGDEGPRSEPAHRQFEQGAAARGAERVDSFDHLPIGHRVVTLFSIMFACLIQQIQMHRLRLSISH